MARMRFSVKSNKLKKIADSRKWLIDSGVTRYMTFYKDWFVDWKLYEGIVEFGNDEELSAIGRGMIYVKIEGRI